jgi:Trk K+ transport system NAD-binding subunit
VVLGNALEERTLEQAGLGSAVAAIGLTTNGEVNGLFVVRAHQLFRVPRGYIALSRLRRGITQEFVQSVEADALFESAHDVGRWILQAERGEVVVEHRRYTAPAPGANAQGLRDVEHRERFAVLTLRRGKQVLPMSVRRSLRTNDVAAIAIHAPDLEDARALLASCGFADLVEKADPPASSSSVA